jgi:hypothetical protein
MIETVEAAQKEWWRLAGEKKRLDDAMRRAKRDGDAVLLLELRDREKVLTAHLLRTEATQLQCEVREREAERARLVKVRDEQTDKLGDLAAEVEEAVEKLEATQQAYHLAEWERSNTETRIRLLGSEIEEKKRELVSMVEGM